MHSFEPKQSMKRFMGWVEKFIYGLLCNLSVDLWLKIEFAY